MRTTRANFVRNKHEKKLAHPYQIKVLHLERNKHPFLDNVFCLC